MSGGQRPDRLRAALLGAIESEVWGKTGYRGGTFRRPPHEIQFLHEDEQACPEPEGNRLTRVEAAESLYSESQSPGFCLTHYGRGG
jgi:hypothetical protein